MGLQDSVPQFSTNKWKLKIEVEQAKSRNKSFDTIFCSMVSFKVRVAASTLISSEVCLMKKDLTCSNSGFFEDWYLLK